MKTRLNSGRNSKYAKLNTCINKTVYIFGDLSSGGSDTGQQVFLVLMSSLCGDLFTVLDRYFDPFRFCLTP